MNPNVKAFLTVVLLVLKSLSLSGQGDKTVNHITGQSILSVSPTLLLNTPGGVQLAGGIKYQLFLGKRVSVDADFVIGRNYLHFGPGAIGLPFALLSDEQDGSISDFLFLIIAGALSFEHLSYHIPAKPDLDISPYVSLLRFKSSYTDNSVSDPYFVDQQLSFAAGLQVNKYFGRFVLAPYGEFNIGYNDLYSRFNTGIYLGIIFPGRRNRNILLK